MRIYIQDYNIKNVNTFLTLFNKYNTHIEEYIEVYSPEGIYNINKNNIIKLNYNDKNIITINNYYKNKTLIIDTSIISHETVNQIPFDHIFIALTRYSYNINKNSQIKFILEVDKNINDNIINYYFENIKETEIDINNTDIKEEIIGFLSLLN